ncbi:MAG: heparinase II/III family protein, partial [Planctomycetes bacterium]|nr:heparinase II/III family protein [Planctomycetota bacterium]
LVLPASVLPALNDGGGGNLSKMAWLLETGCYLFDSEPLRRQLASIHAGRERTQASMSYKIAALLYGPADLPADGTVNAESYLLSDTGLAVLRQDGYTAIVKAGRESGGHDHADRCNLILADANRVWFADLGTSGYGHPLYRPWYRHTASHCTVMVDSKPQQINVRGEILQFDNPETHKLVTVRSDKAYAGITLLRTVALVDGVVLDRFTVAASEPHDYAFMLHAPGDLAVKKAPTTQPGSTSRPAAPAPMAAGAASFPPIVAGLSETRATWTDGKDQLALIAGASAPFAVFGGKVSGFPGDRERSALALVVRGQTAVFAAAYSTGAAGNRIILRAEISPTGAAAFHTAGGKTFRLEPAEGHVRLIVGGATQPQ